MSEMRWDAPYAAPVVGAVVVGLAGDVDVASADEAEDELARAISAARHAGVVVDLSEVTFMDCCGLSVLIRARNSLGDRLTLRNPSRWVTRLLELTDLRDGFVISDEHTGGYDQPFPDGPVPDHRTLVSIRRSAFDRSATPSPRTW